MIGAKQEHRKEMKGADSGEEGFALEEEQDALVLRGLQRRRVACHSSRLAKCPTGSIRVK